MKKVIFLLIFSLILIGCASEKNISQKTFTNVPALNIATDNKLTYNYLVSDMFKEFADKVYIEQTGGSIDNIELLLTKKADIAFIQSDIAFYAKHGLNMYEGKKVENLRGIASLYSEGILILTLAKNEIKAFPEVKGKNLSVGTLGGSMHLNVIDILAAYDMKPEDVEFTYLPNDLAIEALLNGQVDVIFITTAMPVEKIKNIAKQAKPVFLSLDQLMIDELITNYPFYTQMTIERNTYDIQNYFVNTLAIKTLLVTNDDMDKSLVYGILQNMPTEKFALEIVGYNKKTFQEQFFEGMSLPLHEGAKEFWQENR